MNSDRDYRPAARGVSVGIVKENQDPDKLGRVQIEFPYWENQGVSEWARIASPMAGAERGLYFLPEIGDEALVAFENGKFDCPYVIGCLWNGEDAPPEANDDGKNNIRKIRSRSGHEIIFDDDDEGKAEKLVIKSNAGHCITLDDASGGERVSISDKSGNAITLDAAQNAISIECAGELSIKANIITIEADATAEIKAGATMTVKGALVQIN